MTLTKKHFVTKNMKSIELSFKLQFNGRFPARPAGILLQPKMHGGEFAGSQKKSLCWNSRDNPVVDGRNFVKCEGIQGHKRHEIGRQIDYVSARKE